MIRKIELKDRDRWEKLYRGYADFYKVEMNNQILKTVWGWLHDKSHEVSGIVYEAVSYTHLTLPTNREV